MPTYHQDSPNYKLQHLLNSNICICQVNTKVKGLFLCNSCFQEFKFKNPERPKNFYNRTGQALLDIYEDVLVELGYKVDDIVID